MEPPYWSWAIFLFLLGKFALRMLQAGAKGMASVVRTFCSPLTLALELPGAQFPMQHLKLSVSFAAFPILQIGVYLMIL